MSTKQLLVCSTLNLLSSLTEAVIQEVGEPQDEEQTWVDEALESLLDAWTHLLQVLPMSWLISESQLMMFFCAKRSVEQDLR